MKRHKAAFFLDLPTSIFINPTAEMRWLSNTLHLPVGCCRDHTKSHVVRKHLTSQPPDNPVHYYHYPNSHTYTNTHTGELCQTD